MGKTHFISKGGRKLVKERIWSQRGGERIEVRRMKGQWTQKIKREQGG